MHGAEIFAIVLFCLFGLALVFMCIQCCKEEYNKRYLCRTPRVEQL
jgi:hypothetical protein